ESTRFPEKPQQGNGEEQPSEDPNRHILSGRGDELLLPKRVAEKRIVGDRQIRDRVLPWRPFEETTVSRVRCSAMCRPRSTCPRITRSAPFGPLSMRSCGR